MFFIVDALLGEKEMLGGLLSWPRQELHVVGRQMPPVHHSDRCAICEIECPPLYNPFLLASHQSSY